MLAQSARKSGLNPLVIDRFGDQDTQDLANEVHLVKSFEPKVLLPLITDIQTRTGVVWLVLGSGLEPYYKQLSPGFASFQIIGNSLETMANLVNKPIFFKQLEALSIDFPEVRFSPPLEPTGWLTKQYYSEGGMGVKPSSKESTTMLNRYWQKQITGSPFSALFLADQHQCIKMIGFQTQWTTAINADQPFMFKGVINQTPLTVEQQTKILSLIERLTKHYCLVGLNGLDFIANQDGLMLLEINPRPSASLNLYDDDYPNGLLEQHFTACRQLLTDCPSFVPQQVKAYQIVYADKSIQVPYDMSWPSGSRDIPKPSSLIGKYQPICSIIAAGKSSEHVATQLQNKTIQILTQLTGGRKNAIQSQC